MTSLPQELGSDAQQLYSKRFCDGAHRRLLPVRVILPAAASAARRGGGGGKEQKQELFLPGSSGSGRRPLGTSPHVPAIRNLNFGTVRSPPLSQMVQNECVLTRGLRFDTFLDYQ